MRLGIAHHFGWAVAVTAAADHKVVDRRRIELVEPGMAAAPIHHEGKPLDDDATAALVAQVRASAVRATSASLDELATALPEPIVSMSLRAWPLDFPDDIAVQRRPPYEARADSIMYRQVLAELARARGWDVHLYDAKDVEARAVSELAERADEVLFGPRATMGPPWSKDHRMALAATILASQAARVWPEGGGDAVAAMTRVVSTNSFDERAATWDDDPAKVERAGVVAGAISATVPLDGSLRMLEYGAGTGLVTQALRDRVGPVTLADTRGACVTSSRPRSMVGSSPTLECGTWICPASRFPTSGSTSS